MKITKPTKKRIAEVSAKMKELAEKRREDKRKRGE